MKTKVKKRAKVKAESAAPVKPVTMIQPHEWTDGGDKVLILKRINADGTSYNGHRWAESGTLREENWNPSRKCGGGIHGWPWGMGLGEGHDFDIIGDIWLVITSAPVDVIGNLDGGWKCKAKQADIAYRGPFAGAWAMVNSGRHRLIEAMSKVDGGYSSKAASSGDSSKAASSGDFSTAASSGDFSKAASSGDFSTAASSGDYSTAASSGYSSKAASSGDSSKAASGGDYSKAASSGDYSTAASSGNSSKAASSGDSSKAASSGISSTAASSGDFSTAASSGDYSTAASSGISSKAASSGDYSTAASSGYSSTAASSGDYSTAAAEGKDTLACVAGHNGMAKAGLRGAIAIPFWTDAKGWRFVCGKIGEDGIEADTWYRVEDGKLTKA